MKDAIPNGSMMADPVFIAKVRLTGRQISTLCECITEGVIPSDHLAKSIMQHVAELNAELDGVGKSAPGVLR